MRRRLSIAAWLGFAAWSFACGARLTSYAAAALLGEHGADTLRAATLPEPTS